MHAGCKWGASAAKGQSIMNNNFGNSQVSVPEIFFDGIMDIEIIEGVFHCVLFCNRDTHTAHPWKEVMLRVAIPAGNVPECIEAAAGALARHTAGRVATKAKAFLHS